MNKFSQSKRLLQNAKFLFYGWAAIIIQVSAFLILGVVANKSFDGHAMLTMAAVFSPILFYIVIILPIYTWLTFTTKCDKCGKALMFQPLNTTYPKINTAYGLSGFSGTALRIYFSKQFSCMHCGEEYSVEQAAP